MRRRVASPLWIACPLLLTIIVGILVQYFPVGLVYSRQIERPQQEWISCKTVTESRQDGDNRMINATSTANFKGMINGTCEAAERGTIRKDGTQSFSGSGMFSGEVNGHSGTAILTYSGVVSQKGMMNAHWVLDKGTDDLARIDGQGTLEGKQPHSPPNDCGDSESQSAWSGSYAGTVQFPR